MYIERRGWASDNGKVYPAILLRHSYRENGKVKKRTLLNLTHYPPEEVDAIELALKHKKNLAVLGSIKDIIVRNGLSFGAVWAVHEIAKRMGIAKALGGDRDGQLAMWQVIARLIDQGSRLSAARLAKVHAVGSALGLERGFNENHLYENLAWLSDRQADIEDRLLAARRGGPPQLFLYDVTSSYLEGECNYFAAYGYSRDGRKDKKQIVVGLLCDEDGWPVSSEVFDGNTQDPATFASQVRKAADRFGCEHVTFVGDRGMIKQAQIDQLTTEGFHYITAVTKPQIDALIKRGVIQMELFDATVCEVTDGGVRYVLRRNPYRAEEMAASRRSKLSKVQSFVAKQNTYLSEHPRAKVATAEKKVNEKIKKLKIDGWAGAQAEERSLRVTVDEAALEEASRLDGCYVIKTDVQAEIADAQSVHDRYKDLAEVEQAFRTSKTGHLEVRPVHVRREKSTRAHVLVVMLAYLLRRTLAQAWRDLDLTVEEGLEQLKGIHVVELTIRGRESCALIPKPTKTCRRLLEALGLTLPETIRARSIHVDTKRKLQTRRKRK